MNINITSLTQEIEELEKRIKAISTSHSTLAQIIAVRDSLDQVKSCLSDLKTTIEENNDSSFQTELVALSQRIDIVENDISALQSANSGTEDDISAIQDEISAINSCIGEHTTTITNLQTTQTSLQTAQTNLQTTQSSQASSINNNTNNISALKTRMTTAESNISALSGGIDLGDLESKVDSIPETYFSHVDLTMHLVVNNTTDKSRFYNYKVDLCDVVYERFKLNYTTESNDTMTINYCRNDELIKTMQVDLSLNPSSFEFDCINYPEERYNIYQFEISSTEKVVFTGLQTTIFGKNAQVFENDKDLKVEIYDNNYYVTKYENEAITYEKILAGTPLKIENLAYDMNDLKTKTTMNFRAGGFGPRLTNSSELIVELDKDAVVREATTDRDLYTSMDNFLVPDNEKAETYNAAELFNSIVMTFCSGAGGPSGIISKNRYPSYYYLASLSNVNIEISKLNISAGEYYFATFARYNNYINGETKICTLEDLPILAGFEDGYLYMVYGENGRSATKVAKYGQFATAYLQDDKSVNIYINKGYSTHMYTLIKTGRYDYDVQYIKTFINCDCLYELNNNSILKHTKAGWIIENLETVEDDISE